VTSFLPTKGLTRGLCKISAANSFQLTFKHHPPPEKQQQQRNKQQQQRNKQQQQRGGKERSDHN